MSATAKIKESLVKMVNAPENKGGLTYSEVWAELEKSEFSDELVNEKGERRSGTLVGLTTRIKAGKVEGVKVIKDANNRLLYVSSGSSIDYLISISQKFLKQAQDYKLPENLNEKQEAVVNQYMEQLEFLNKSTSELQKVAIEIEAQHKQEATEPKNELEAQPTKKAQVEKVASKVDKKETTQQKKKSEIKDKATNNNKI